MLVLRRSSRFLQKWATTAAATIQEQHQPNQTPPIDPQRSPLLTKKDTRSPSAIPGGKEPKSPTGEFLRHEKIKFRLANDKEVELESVIQDTMPQGSHRGTVVAIHGAPGSHKDFKYMLPLLRDYGIRLVAINFPGFGLTPGTRDLRYDNTERLNYVQQVVDRLALKRNLIFIGHSRGSENALKLGAVNSDRTVGIILCNPIGLRANRGVRPFWVVRWMTFLIQSGGFLKLFLRPFLYWYYTRILKFKLPPGKTAANSVIAINTADFTSQLKYIEKLNQVPVPVLIAYAGKDFLLEVEIEDELIAQFKDAKKLVCDDDKNPESAVAAQFDAFLHSGTNHIAVLFERDNHFLQKFRAKFLAEAINSMLERKENEK